MAEMILSTGAVPGGIAEAPAAAVSPPGAESTDAAPTSGRGSDGVSADIAAAPGALAQSTKRAKKPIVVVLTFMAAVPERSTSRCNAVHFGRVAFLFV
jgi:hypothetical protein